MGLIANDNTFNLIILALVASFLISGCSNEHPVPTTYSNPYSEIEIDVHSTKFNPPQIESTTTISSSDLPLNLQFYNQAYADTQPLIQTLNYSIGGSGHRIYFCVNDSLDVANKKLYSQVRSLGWLQSAFYTQQDYYAFEASSYDAQLLILSHKSNNGQQTCNTIQTK